MKTLVANLDTLLKSSLHVDVRVNLSSLYRSACRGFQAAESVNLHEQRWSDIPLSFFNSTIDRNLVGAYSAHVLDKVILKVSLPLFSQGHLRSAFITSSTSLRSWLYGMRLKPCGLMDGLKPDPVELVRVYHREPLTNHDTFLGVARAALDLEGCVHLVPAVLLSAREVWRERENIPPGVADMFEPSATNVALKRPLDHNKTRSNPAGR
jgi:hypothetical protein